MASIPLVGRKTVDGILSSFHKAIRDLETLRDQLVSDAQKFEEAADDLRSTADEYDNKADACVAEADRAARSARKISEFIG